MEDERSAFEKAAGENASLLGDTLAFLRENKKWWILPIAAILALISAVVLFGGTAAAPFIYTLF
jgi:hypothetical protein